MSCYVDASVSKYALVYVIVYCREGVDQGFMQDKIIASHTCFGGHMDVNC